MEICVQSAAGGNNFAAWHSEFKLSAVIAADVSCMGGVAGQIHTVDAVFLLDIRQQTFRLAGKKRNIIFCGGDDLQRSFVAAYQGIVF